MSKSQIQDLLAQLNGDCGACALASWDNWTFWDFNLLLIHSHHCDGCNNYCEKMKLYWDHQYECMSSARFRGKNCRFCKAISMLFHYHVKCCSEEECRVPCCLQFRAREMAEAEMDNE